MTMPEYLEITVEPTDETGIVKLSIYGDKNPLLIHFFSLHGDGSKLIISSENIFGSEAVGGICK